MKKGYSQGEVIMSYIVKHGRRKIVEGSVYSATAKKILCFLILSYILLMISSSVAFND